MTMQTPISKLHRAQTQMLLDVLGIPVRDQSKKTSENKNKLEIFKRTDVDSYNRAYSIIIDKEYPGEGAKEIVNVMKYQDASLLVTNSVMELETNSRENIDKFFSDKGNKLVSTIKEKFADAVARESKKYNTIAVKVGGKKAKQVKGVVPENFKRLCQLAQSRVNILLVGPSGCGKTYVAEQIADALDLDYSSQSCSAGVSESNFSGWLIPVGKSGQFVYVSSEFVRIYENGGVFLFDEMDASDPNVLVFLNAALANKGFNIPQRHENPYAKKSPDFVAIGAANTNGSGADEMYHGRNALDEATMDRFRIGTVFMDYSDQVESQLIDSEILEWGRNIRHAIKSNKLKRIMSTRAMLDTQTMIKDHDWSIADAEQGYFSSWSPEELRIIGRPDMVRK